MNVLLLRFGRHVALCLAILVSVQMSEAAVLPLQQEPVQQPATPAQQQQPAQQQPAQQQPTSPDAPAPAAGQPAAAGQDEPAPGFASRSQDAAAQDVEHKDAQNPVGTAAAPLSRPSGVAGSRPAGAAIAPAKQKRVKAIFIRVGLIVAGAAAVGAVYGLTKGSPSHPQ